MYMCACVHVCMCACVRVRVAGRGTDCMEVHMENMTSSPAFQCIISWKDGYGMFYGHTFMDRRNDVCRSLSLPDTWSCICFDARYDLGE